MCVSARIQRFSLISLDPNNICKSHNENQKRFHCKMCIPCVARYCAVFASEKKECHSCASVEYRRGRNPTFCVSSLVKKTRMLATYLQQNHCVYRERLARVIFFSHFLFFFLSPRPRSSQPRKALFFEDSSHVTSPNDCKLLKNAFARYV